MVRRLHGEFHETAGKVVALAQSARTAAAEKAYTDEFMPRSEKLVRALTKWKNELI